MASTALRHATADPQPTAEPLASPASAQAALAALEDARRGTRALVAPLSNEQLLAVHSPIMSPLVWDLAHIAAYEDLWIAHRHAGMELARPDLADLYDAFETPRSARGRVELPGPGETRRYMDEVRARTAEALERVGTGDGTVCEMVVRHELQHQETMRQTMALAGLLPPGEPRLAPLDESRREHGIAGPEERIARHRKWIAVPAGPFEMGAGPDGFAYDNERPRHGVQVGAFEIGRRPVTNGSWMAFVADGGYTRRALWSEEGWAWKNEHDIAHDRRVAAGHPDAPVCHVSWFEAQAYAEAAHARLPSEAEWERAAVAGLLSGVRQVWEWTRSRFEPYPGFVAHPYREYSEVFFGGDYRVLRGGSWATSPRVATVTFRNWDHPMRRQIFAGVRLARDVA